MKAKECVMRRADELEMIGEDCIERSGQLWVNLNFKLPVKVLVTGHNYCIL